MPLSATATFRPRNDLGQFVDARVTPGVKASVEAACKLIETRAKELVPVRTGELRDSIHTTVEETGKTIVGRVGSDLPRAVWTEYGTGIRGAESAGAGQGPYSSTWPGMAAKPWLRPSVDESKGAIMDIFKSNVLVSL